MTDDTSLLRRFVQQHANDAFAELVRRHLNLVYFAALRQTHGDTHHAEDAAQATFTFLAQKAGSLLAHPNLAGWLHTVACHHARDLNRAEHRRLQREQTAHVMHEITSAEANDETWAQVRPIIDDALQDLAPDDREAVLLRYFENRPFAEIGVELQLGENAARMRVTRALGQLETALARRGVKSTSAALATVLAIPAVMAAPPGLAGTISSTALTATVLTASKIMISAKLITTVASLTAFAALGTAIYQHNQLQASRVETAALRQKQSDLQADLAIEKKRAAEASGKLQAITANALPPLNSSAPVEEQLTNNGVMARYNNARILAQNGRYEEALKDFLWCYDIGMVKVTHLNGSRRNLVIPELAMLRTKYAPALKALQERRDAAEQVMLVSEQEVDAVKDYAQLNQALGEHMKNLDFFTSLSAKDNRRQFLIPFVSDQLLASQRYNEIVQTNTFSRMQTSFVLTSASIDETPKLPPAHSKGRIDRFADTTSKNIEALAGAGEIDNAGKLIGKLLEFDNSTETRAKIQEHLTRAGHPELLKAQ